MIILGRQELKPSIVQAPQAEWEKSLDHTTETSLPLVELAQRHARGAVALRNLVIHDGPLQAHPKLDDLSRKIAERSSAAQGYADEIERITSMQLGVPMKQMPHLAEALTDNVDDDKLKTA